MKMYLRIVITSMLIVVVIVVAVFLAVNIGKNIIAVSNVKKSGSFSDSIKKIVVIAPHPDDEVIGVGGSVLHWLVMGKDVHIVYITDGRAAYKRCFFINRNNT